MSDTIWARNGGVYLGFKTNRLEGPSPPIADPLSYQSDRHLITFGPNGSGKTRRLLVPNLFGLTDWSILVIDPKAELAKMTAQHRRNAGNHVILLNPFDLFGMGSQGCNPIRALDASSDDFPDDALNLAEAIVRGTGRESEPHWVQSAQDLMTALIMYAKLTPQRSCEDGTIEYRDNFAFVRSCLGRTAKRFAELIGDMIEVGLAHDCEELCVKAGRFAEISADNKELNSIISTTLTQSRWLDSRPIKQDLNGEAIDFGVMKQRPTVIYLCLPARRLVTQAPWLRLMVAAIMQQLMRDAVRPKVPVLLMLDEFAQLGHLSAIENNVAVMRGFGVKLWAVFQDLAQARDLYERRWESFMSNAGVLNGFAPQDLVTAKYLSDRGGVTTVPIMTLGEETTVTNLEAPAGTLSYSHIQRPLIYPQELREIDDGYLVAFTHTIKGTVRCYAPFYTELPGMADIAARDPSL